VRESEAIRSRNGSLTCRGWRFWFRVSTQGSSWGYLKVNSLETLSIFGDKCPQNGSKNDLMAPRTTLECPHEGILWGDGLRVGWGAAGAEDAQRTPTLSHI
jgi:hypothetical protein